MTEEEVNKEYDVWLSDISKFIVSRSSRFLSSETQKDGRVLLLLSALSSLFYIGIVQFSEYSSQGIKFTVASTFIPIIIETVCLYFAVSFFIDAYSELKAWQFKTLIKGSGDENPLKNIEKEQQEISNKGNEILNKYKDLINKAQREFGINISTESLPETNDLNQIQEYTRMQEERFEQLEKYKTVSEIYFAAQDVELKELGIKRDILNFKIKSFTMEIPSIVKAYKFKYYINIVFPLISFIISIIALVYYFVKHD